MKVVTFTGDRVGEFVTAGALVSALESALVWLRGKDAESAVDWEVVKVRISRAVRITFKNPSANGDISARMKNLDLLQRKRMPASLPRLTDADIEGTKELANVLERQGFTSMRISSPGEPTVKVTPTLIERVAEVERKVPSGWYEWTSLRGTVDQITAGASAYRFRLRHQIDKSEIACEFDADRIGVVKDALSKRVEVYGRVRYGRSNNPKSMAVETIRILPDNLRPFSTVPGIDITSGMSSADYVERVRGGE